MHVSEARADGQGEGCWPPSAVAPTPTVTLFELLHSHYLPCLLIPALEDDSICPLANNGNNLVSADSGKGAREGYVLTVGAVWYVSAACPFPGT